MGEDAKDEFTLLGRRSARSQRGAESALVPAEGALRMPALVVERLRKPLPHFSTVAGAWPAASLVAGIQLDDASSHAEFFTAEPVIVLGIVASIRKRGIDGKQTGCLPHGRGEVRRVLGGTGPRHRTQDEVRVRVDDCRQLGPGAPPPVLALGLAAADTVVETDVPSFKPGSVDCRHRSRSNQSCPRGRSKNRPLGAEKDPPFSAPERSRCSA